MPTSHQSMNSRSRACPVCNRASDNQQREGGDGGGSSLDKIYQETFNWALIILARAQLGLRAKRGGRRAGERRRRREEEERAMESLEDKVLSSGCALGKQRSANNHCPSLGGRGRERAGNVCKGSLRPGRRGFLLLLLLFLIITAVKAVQGFLGRCSQERSGEEAKGPGGTCYTAKTCSARAGRTPLPGAKRGSVFPPPPPPTSPREKPLGCPSPHCLSAMPSTSPAPSLPVEGSRCPLPTGPPRQRGPRRTPARWPGPGGSAESPWEKRGAGATRDRATGRKVTSRGGSDFPLASAPCFSTGNLPRP